jgi:hypothetical protein
MAGNDEGLMKTGFRLCRMWIEDPRLQTLDAGLQEQLSLQPVQLGLPVMFSSFLYQSERLSQHA